MTKMRACKHANIRANPHGVDPVATRAHSSLLPSISRSTHEHVLARAVAGRRARHQEAGTAGGTRAASGTAATAAAPAQRAAETDGAAEARRGSSGEEGRARSGVEPAT